MEDIRSNDYRNKLKRRLLFDTILSFFKKNWIKIILTIVFGCLIFFPEFFGNITGGWFNKLVISFIENLTF